MVHASWCSATFSLCSSGILEIRVSGTLDRTRLTNSTACFFPSFKSLRFLPLKTSESTVYATEVSGVEDLQQGTQNGFEMIRTAPGIFQPVGQSVHRRATSCDGAEDGRFEHFL